MNSHANTKTKKDTNSATSLAPHDVIWVVGATGLVGRAILDILFEEWNLPASAVRAVASPKRAGQKFSCSGGRAITLASFESLTSEQLSTPADSRHFFLLATDSHISREWTAHVHALGLSTLFVIDASSAYRMDPDVPLVIPEINGHRLGSAAARGAPESPGAPETSSPRVIASPNCTTIGLLLGVLPFWRAFNVRRIVVSTYQAASGAGYRAQEALANDIKNGTRASSEFFPYPLADNCIPQIGDYDAAGWTQEENKVIRESGKIFETDIPIHATCVRVPVGLGHSESVALETAQPVTTDALKAAIDNFSHPEIIFSEPIYESRPLADIHDSNLVAISRVRVHPDDPRHIHFWVQFDNIRIGAATNVCRILRAMLK